VVTQEELEKMSPEEIAKLQKDNCIFCKIVRGEIPSKKVYEDSDVLAILDINPARKGHVLVMPKEHFPILPLIPPDKFSKLFSAVKLIAQGIRESMLVDETTIFIANGAVAGQQSPHFLFHIFPRDKDDGLTNFDLKENPSVLDDQKSLEPSLKNNLSIMLSKIIPSTNKESTINTTAIAGADQQDLIAQLIDEHEDVRNLLIDDPDSFKKQLEGNPRLKELFNGIDLNALSEKLKDSLKSSAISPEEDKQNIDSTVDDTPVEDNGSNKLSPALVEKSSKVVNDEESSDKIFSGPNPEGQKNLIKEYFSSKPKAKQLLIDDPNYFKELLDKRPDISDLFKDVNLNLLSIALTNSEWGSKDD